MNICDKLFEIDSEIEQELKRSWRKTKNSKGRIVYSERLQRLKEERVPIFLEYLRNQLNL